MNFIVNRSKGGAQWNPLHKTMFYSILILFRQAGAPSLYGHRSKCRLWSCSRTLVGAGKDQTQAFRMRGMDSITDLLLLIWTAYTATCLQLHVHVQQFIFIFTILLDDVVFSFTCIHNAASWDISVYSLPLPCRLACSDYTVCCHL